MCVLEGLFCRDVIFGLTGSYVEVGEVVRM